MKTLLIIIALLISTICFAQQKVSVDTKGNYIITKKDSSVNKPTGKTIIDKEGVSHLVFITEKGKLYYMRTSKSGNTYKCYFKI